MDSVTVSFYGLLLAFEREQKLEEFNHNKNR